MHMKNWLRSQRFNNNKELKADIETWLSTLVADFIEQGILQLVPRYDKCLNSGGDYTEK
jgi:hypothetical protein